MSLHNTDSAIELGGLRREYMENYFQMMARIIRDTPPKQLAADAAGIAGLFFVLMVCLWVTP